VKLSLKLLAALAAVILVVLGTNGYLNVLRQTASFDSDMRHDALSFGRPLAQAVLTVAAEKGRPAAEEVVAHANAASTDVRLRLVSLELDAEPARKPHLSVAQLERVREGHPVQDQSDDEAHGAGFLVTYLPLSPDVLGGRDALEISESMGPPKAYIRESIRRTVVVTTTLLLMCFAAMSALGVFFVGRPVRLLAAKARRIGAGDLSGPVVLRQRDELRELGNELNTMCDRLAEATHRLHTEMDARVKALEQLRHADRLATVGRLAAGIAHEIGTPLNVVTGRAHRIATGEATGDEVIGNARIVEEQARRITGTIRQLLDFARKRPARKIKVDLGALIARTLTLLDPIAAKRQVELAGHDPRERTFAEVDASQIEQALTNIVMNAVQATGAGGKVQVHLETLHATPPPEHDESPGPFVRMVIADTGSGMAPDTMAHIFEPFFTTKDVGEGTGLGLPVTYGIVREHGGWISVESTPGEGSQFSVYLPGLSAAAAPAPALAPDLAPALPSRSG